ncbi:MAG: hypothetical protein H6741_25625 [Alphaproteobacteria bacterium]|nr:hypothetical protein [Alphaproteobacteria bacterium]MCB9796091.1 hypothetical protein [Alphaproteobacteria bacterium]
MDNDELYGFIVDAVRQALAEEAGGGDVRLHPRMVEGEVIFKDGQGREVKVVPATAVFKKITAVRERLRVLEQKVNNHSSLSDQDQAELQALISRAYGSLTTFNFLFRHDADKFKGTGG